MSSIYDIEVTDIHGRTYPLREYEGQVMLIVNTASKCGFTPQFKGLETLYEKYKDKGFVVLGFPCNQFMSQEPGDESEIEEFCTLNYGVTFPMHKKGDVNGPNTQPLFRYLKKAAPGLMGSEAIKWNFTKFLVDAQGNVIRRYPPTTKPEEIEKDIVKLLKG